MTHVPYAGDEALRRPVTPSGTSLIGLVKHLAGGEYGWLCDTFGRSHEVLPFDFEEDIEADMRAAGGETAADILAFYARARAASDQVIAELDLEATGTAWFGDTVRKPAGFWSPSVEALLAHLEAREFTGAPRPRGGTTLGRRVLEYVPGPMAIDQPPLDAAGLHRVGRLIRDLHDASAGFEPLSVFSVPHGYARQV